MRRRGTGHRSPLARFLPPLAMWPALIFLGLFFLFPVIKVLTQSFLDPTFTLKHYSRLLSVPVYRDFLLRTFEIALTVSFFCLVLGYPTAYLLSTIPARLSGLLIVFVMLPFFTSVLVRNYAWLFILGAHGVINTTLVRLGVISDPLPLMFNRFGVVLGMVHVLLPYMVLVLLSVMQDIKPELTRAAHSLMGGAFTSFRRVFLPLTLPGIGAGFLMVFVLALAFFITPAMLGGPRDQMIANLVADATTSLNWGFASALSMVLLFTSAIVLILTQRLFGGIGLLAPMAEDPRRILKTRRTSEGPLVWAIDTVLNPTWASLHWIIGLAVLAFLFLPLLMIVPLSLTSVAYFVFPPPGLSWQWYREYFTNRDWLEATKHSFQIGALAMGLATGMAVPAALGISRWRSPLNKVFYLAILAPLVVPGIVVAVAAFSLLADLRLTDTIWGVALGHTIVALPMATVVLAAALRNFDPSLERAASSLGASPFKVTVRVTLPILSTAVFSAAFFAFLQSFDELLIALFVSGIQARTLPKKLWVSLQEVDPTIAAVSTLSIVLTMAVVGALYLLRRAGERRGTNLLRAETMR